VVYGFVYFMPGRTLGQCGVSCHGVSFHVRTDARMLVLGLINAKTLAETNAYDCVRANERHQ